LFLFCFLVSFEAKLTFLSSSDVWQMGNIPTQEFAKCRRCGKGGKERQSTAWREGHRFWCSAKDVEEDTLHDHSQSNQTSASTTNAVNTPSTDTGWCYHPHCCPRWRCGDSCPCDYYDAAAEAGTDGQGERERGGGFRSTMGMVIRALYGLCFTLIDLRCYHPCRLPLRVGHRRRRTLTLRLRPRRVRRPV